MFPTSPSKQSSAYSVVLVLFLFDIRQLTQWNGLFFLQGTIPLTKLLTLCPTNLVGTPCPHTPCHSLDMATPAKRLRLLGFTWVTSRPLTSQSCTSLARSAQANLWPCLSMEGATLGHKPRLTNISPHHLRPLRLYQWVFHRAWSTSRRYILHPAGPKM